MWLTIVYLIASFLWRIENISFDKECASLNCNNLRSSFSTSPQSAQQSKSQYTNQEQCALKKFRRMVVNETFEQDYQKTDAYLIRWLRASELRIRDARKLLQEAQVWRKQNSMSSILNEKVFEFHLPEPPCHLEGTDLEGNPLAIVTLLREDIRKQMVTGHHAKLLRYIHQCLEKTETKIHQLANSTIASATGKSVTQAVTIVDSNGYNLKQHGCFNCLSMYLDMVRSLEKYYPAIVRYIVIINVPPMAQPFIEMMRPVLSKNSQNGLRIFGSDRHEWSAFLQTIISQDQLPEQFRVPKKLSL